MPPEIDKQAFYEVYRALFRLPTDDYHRTWCLTALMGAQAWSWPVVGITPAALECFAAADYMKPKGMVDRGHLKQRRETAVLAFRRDVPIPTAEELFDFFLERDKTLLVTKAENKTTSKEVPRYIPIDPALGLFECKHISYHHRLAERAFLRELHARYRAGEIALV